MGVWGVLVPTPIIPAISPTFCISVTVYEGDLSHFCHPNLEPLAKGHGHFLKSTHDMGTPLHIPHVTYIIYHIPSFYS